MDDDDDNDDDTYIQQRRFSDTTTNHYDHHSLHYVIPIPSLYQYCFIAFMLISTYDNTIEQCQ